jgi:predicted  nucleic acid-binding Zn-ribbon protein
MIDVNSPDDVKRNNKIDSLKRDLVKVRGEVVSVQSQIDTLNSSIQSTQEELNDKQSGLSDDKTESEQVSSLRVQLNEALEELDQLNTRISQGKVLPDLNVLVRPVSDEFGFEVIGHYRYGRGAFMDRGQIKVADSSGNIANELNIQFSPSAGLIENYPFDTNAAGLSPETINFSEAFEKMRPEDWQTGASFRGAEYSDDDAISDINMTGQATYRKNLENSRGATVFVEADALRKSVTLGELKPTIGKGPLDEAIANCNCWLGRAKWLSVLPQSIVGNILGNQSVTTQAGIAEAIEDATGDEGVAESVLDVLLSARGLNTNSIATPDGFFEQLNNFLIEKFQNDYTFNRERESWDTSGGKQVYARSEFADNANNILPDPKSALYQRASLGDPDALEALKNDVNLNFGLTKEATKNFKEQFALSKDKFNKSLRDLRKSLGFIPLPSSSGVSVSTLSSDQQQLQQSQEELAESKRLLADAQEFLRDNPGNNLAREQVEQLEKEVALSEKEVEQARARVDANGNSSQAQPEAIPVSPSQVFNQRLFERAREQAERNSEVDPVLPKVTSNFFDEET